jgi:hypothetical protein
MIQPRRRVRVFSEVGIAISGIASVSKEPDPAADRLAPVTQGEEFHFWKGLLVAMFAAAA